MANFSRMPRYDIRNDGAGPYCIFYCDNCNREFRSNPDLAGTVTQDIGRQAASGFLRKVPLFGGAIADSVVGEDPRYSYKMSPQQIESAWQQVQMHFRECPTCSRIVCLSDFDTVSGFCNDDTPRTAEIAEAQGEQTGAALKGLANAFGLSGVFQQAGQAMNQAADAAKRAASQSARCPNDGTLAAAGTKFCPECGTPMVQPQATLCPNCGADAKGAKFCPECGTPMVQPEASLCPNCGADAKGAKFCPECGTKIEQKPAAQFCPNCGAEAKGAKFCPECGTKIG